MVRAADDVGKRRCVTCVTQDIRNRAGSALSSSGRGNLLLEASRRRAAHRTARRARSASVRAVADAAALRAQLAYLERSSPFYRERLARRARARGRPAARPRPSCAPSQAARPPFGEHLCAPRRGARAPARHLGHDRRAGGHRPHARRPRGQLGASAARRSRIAGVRRSDVIAHCLNYALYAGGIADHMALEASGATVVPVGVGQSQRLLDLIPRLGHHRDLRHAVLPRPPRRPRAARPGIEPARARPAPHRHRRRAGRRPGRRARARSRAPGAPRWPTRSA